MIMQLREDWTPTHGGAQRWKAFHDQFLSYGGPPIPLVRAQMLGGKPEAKLWTRRRQPAAAATSPAARPDRRPRHATDGRAGAGDDA